MCYECATILQKSFDFKSACIYTEDCLFPFAESKNSCKLDLWEIYLKINEIQDIKTIEYEKVCRYCMKLVKSGYTSMNEVLQNVTAIKYILEEYFPETDLLCIEEPIICMECLDFLQVFSNFIAKQLHVEEQIELYRKFTGIISGHRINLLHVQQLISGTLSRNETNLDTQIEVKLEQISHIKAEQVMLIDVKSESGIQDAQLNTMSLLQTGTLPPPSTSVCNGDNSDSLVRTDNNLVKRKKFRCKQCSYKFRSKKRFEEHMSTHQASVKALWCPDCKFKTKYSRNLRNHRLLHADPSKVTMHKCDICDYESIYASYVVRHMQAHVDASQVKTYQCEFCAFKTTFRLNLYKHIPVHKNASGMFQCQKCNFKASMLHAFRRHLLVHTEPMKCHLCDFQSKHKHTFNRHMLLHTAPSELTQYQCKLCPFKTTSKCSIKYHKAQHVRSKVYKYKLRPYETKRGGNLPLPMLQYHNDASGVTIYKCDFCLHETRYKSNLMRHMERHKNPSDKTEK